MEDRKGVSLDERGGREELGGVEKENVIRVCYVEKNKPNINEMEKKRTLREI